MTLRIVLTDGDGVQGLTGVFGAFLVFAGEQAAADAIACDADAAAAAASAVSAATQASLAAGSAFNADASSVSATASAVAADASRASAVVAQIAASNSSSSASTSASSADASSVAANNNAMSAALSAASASASATPVAAAAALINQLSGRNRAINGAMEYSQIPSATVPNNVTSFAGADMWSAINNGAGGQFTISQSTFTYQGRVIHCQVAQTNTVAADLTTTKYWVPLRYIAEGIHIYDLVNQPFVISFPFYCTIAGNYSISIRDSTAAYSFVTNFSAVVGSQYISVPVPAAPAGATMVFGPSTGIVVRIGCLNNGTFNTPTPGAWTTGDYLNVAGGAAWGSTVNAAIAVGQFQIELGTVPSVFEKPEFAATVLACNRYLTQLQFNHSGLTAAGVIHQNFKEFMIPMRALPIGTTIAAGTSSNVGAPVLGINSNGAQANVTGIASGQFTSQNWIYRFACRLGEVA